MMKKSIFLSFFFLVLLLLLTGVWNGVFSQSRKINFPLLKIISQPEKQNDLVHLAVVGETEKIKVAVRSYGGTFKYGFSVSGYLSPDGKNKEASFISIHAKDIKAFSKNDFVERIEFSGGKASVLNDSVKINMNVLPVHEGIQPLLEEYSGSGVLLGIIDAGIGLDHPDFLDASGRTRVVSVWDQTVDTSSQYFDLLRVPLPYGYGQVWDSADINGGYHHHNEQSGFYGHGSHVAGIAGGDGSSDSIPVYTGMAPDANLIVVSSDFEANDWLQTVADAVDYIFNKADEMNKPCVINISAGVYSGSHDGLDLAAQYINNLVAFNSGRAVVCAAGNAGQYSLFHLRTTIASDTKFTWFKKNPGFIVPGYSPGGGVYFELFADTADFNNVSFSFGADKTSPAYELRGTSDAYNIKNLFNGVYTLDQNGIFSDTLKNSAGQRIAKIYFGAEIINNGGTYALYVLLSPDSSQYNYRFSSSGTGKFDVWSSEWMGYSDMVYDSLPSFSAFPDIANYSTPDDKQSIVSSFTCSPNVITVGNYTNRYSYVSFFGNEVFSGSLPGTLFPTSSKGPTRDGRTKPDIAGPGGFVLSAANLPQLAIMQSIGSDQLGPGGMHREFSGTSMSSPAVAGLAALYFQKCPNAGISDLYYAITLNARTDSSTGTVPNNSWGYGKADAFATLISSNFSVGLTNPDSIACPGPVKLTVDSTFSFYQWNNGASGKSTTVNQSGNYFATVTSQKGCKGRSDTVAVYINDSLFSPGIVVNGDPFFCEGDSVGLSYPDTFLAYQWTSGNITSGIFAGATGFYSVTATAANGCKFPSDSVLVWAKPNPPEPTVSQTADTLVSSPGNSYLWYLNGLILAGDTNQNLTVSQTGYYQAEVFHVNGCSAISDSLYVVKTGEDRLQGMGFRFKVFPNPGDGKFVLRFWDTEGDFFQDCQLKVCNFLGEIVFSDSFSLVKKEHRINLSHLPPGFYFISLTDKKGVCFSEKIAIQ